MKSLLVDLGLTESEANVYLCLLRRGASTNTPIARTTGLQSSSVYYCLNRLLEKGFVSYIVRRGRKHYLATRPEALLALIDDEQDEIDRRRERLVNALPRFKQLQERHEDAAADMLEGFRGITYLFNEILATLEKGDEYCAIAVEEEPGVREELSLLFQRHNKELHRRGILLRLLTPERMRSRFLDIYGKRFLKTYQQIRYIDEGLPVGTTIYKDTVVTHIVQDDIPLAFRIKNAKYASVQREHFESLWRRAKP